jgi:REP element-mobilizing transposase RayT
VGAVSTHIHVLIAGDPQTDFPRLIGHLKGGSATTWNKVHAESAGWKMQWAPGYGLSTVGRTQVTAVREYLRRQPEHHPLERIEGWEGDRHDQELLR